MLLFKKLIKTIRVKRQRLSLLHSVGCHTDIHETVKITYHRNLTLGDYVHVGSNCYLDAEGGIQIHDGAILGPNIVILSSSHNYRQSKMLPYDEVQINRSVSIGRGVWIGWGAMICPGVVIGDGAVVAMGAVVSRNVKEGQVVGGNPARVISERDNIKDVLEAIEHSRYYIKEKAENGLKRPPRGKIGNP